MVRIASPLPRAARPPGFLGRGFSTRNRTISFDMFFDRPAIVSKLDDYRRRVMIKQGAYARGVLQKNQRYGGASGKSSNKGEFPQAQEGSIRRLSVFAYDDLTDSTVVGPIGFGRLPRGYALAGGLETIPQLLNEGGVVFVDKSEAEQTRKQKFRRIRGRKPSAKATDKNGKKRRRRGGVARRTRSTRYRIEERPFVRLTLDIVSPQLADIAARVPFR